MIQLPYKLIAGALILFAITAAAEYDGYKRSDAKWTAKTLAEERAYTELYQAEVNRGNELSSKLAATESNIQIKTIERIKYVDKVTTGKSCLSADAVGLLNHGSETAMPEAAGEPVAESSGASASDSDILTWAIEAHQYYDTCSVRLNTLIDWTTDQPR